MPVARFLLLLAVPASLAVEACVHPVRSAALAHGPPETRAPAPHGDVVDDPRTPPDDGRALPPTWSVAYGHDRSVTEAFAVARRADNAVRATLATTAVLASAPPSPPGALQPVDLERVASQLDRVTRAYAATFHAGDATRIDQVEALALAADVVLRGSRYLDQHGLHDSAKDARTDTRVSLSFEDVERGPGRHWRDEGLALARHCVVLASADELDALRETCMHLVQDYPAATRRGSAGACACDPGDPLCSSSMSGWCPPPAP